MVFPAGVAGGEFFCFDVFRSRVKGRCPLRVQGGAREVLAARQSPPTGVTRTLKSKPDGLRYLLPAGNPRRQA